MTSALLIRLGGLGDLLVALPALRLVRVSFPDAFLHLLARKEYGGLLLEAGVVNAVSAADDIKWMPLFDAGGPVLANAGGQAETPVPPRLARGGGPGKAPVPAHAGGQSEFRRELSRYDWIAGWFHGRVPPREPGRTFSPVPTREPGRTKVGVTLLPREFLYDPASGSPLSRYFFDRTADALRSIVVAPAASFDDCRLLFPTYPPRR